MKILIAEDDATTRLLLRRFLKFGKFEVADAINGAEALKLLQSEYFDAVITDWMMPKMDGMELIEEIRKTIFPTPFILMLTAIDTAEAKAKAFVAGADAFLAKPFHSEEVIQITTEGIMQHQQGKEGRTIVEKKIIIKMPPFMGVGVASSTGGPPTLLKVFSDIAETDKAAFFLVQHGPVWMLESFVARLQEVTTMKVHLGKDKEKIQPGNIYLSPGEVHMVIDPELLEIRLINDPPENYCRPSADPLFRSIASAFHKNCLGVVLTGMGRDGTIGSGYIKVMDGSILAQDPATAMIASMPQSIIELKLANSVKPLNEIGKHISQFVQASHPTVRNPLVVVHN